MQVSLLQFLFLSFAETSIFTNFNDIEYEYFEFLYVVKQLSKLLASLAIANTSIQENHLSK